MEKEGNVGTTTTTNSAPPPQVPPAKKHRRWSLFRAALFVVRRGGQADKKGPIHANAPDSPVRTDSIWRSLLCGMRPLLLQPPQLAKHELFHDTPLPPPSPAGSGDGMSRYASAEDLQALDKRKEDQGEEEEEEEDATIDVRAEEFIARFYEQMRLQRLDSCSDQDG